MLQLVVFVVRFSFKQTAQPYYCCLSAATSLTGVTLLQVRVLAPLCVALRGEAAGNTTALRGPHISPRHLYSSAVAAAQELNPPIDSFLLQPEHLQGALQV